MNNNDNNNNKKITDINEINAIFEAAQDAVMESATKKSSLGPGIKNVDDVLAEREFLIDIIIHEKTTTNDEVILVPTYEKLKVRTDALIELSNSPLLMHKSQKEYILNAIEKQDKILDEVNK